MRVVEMCAMQARTEHFLTSSREIVSLLSFCTLANYKFVRCMSRYCAETHTKHTIRHSNSKVNSREVVLKDILVFCGCLCCFDWARNQWMAVRRQTQEIVIIMIIATHRWEGRRNCRIAQSKIHFGIILTAAVADFATASANCTRFYTSIETGEWKENKHVCRCIKRQFLFRGQNEKETETQIEIFSFVICTHDEQWSVLVNSQQTT